jgi:hypothetical protein
MPIHDFTEAEARRINERIVPVQFEGVIHPDQEAGDQPEAIPVFRVDTSERPDIEALIAYLHGGGDPAVVAFPPPLYGQASDPFVILSVEAGRPAACEFSIHLRWHDPEEGAAIQLLAQGGALMIFVGDAAEPASSLVLTIDQEELQKAIRLWAIRPGR